MSEVSKHQSVKKAAASEGVPKKRPEGISTTGIYNQSDNARYIEHLAVPTLAVSLGARTPTLRGLQNRFGSFDRDVTHPHGNGDRTYYRAFAERISDIDKNGKKLAKIVLELTITNYHTLTDVEVISEWELLEQIGLADDLIADAISNHGLDVKANEIDLDDPDIQMALMRAQSEFMNGSDVDDGAEPDGYGSLIDELDDEDDEEPMEDSDSLAEMLFGQTVERYHERRLRIVSGQRPILVTNFGYNSDTDSHKVNTGNEYGRNLVGQTPAELRVIAQLDKEMFRQIDSSVIEEFEEVLRVVGILAKHTRSK